LNGQSNYGTDHVIPAKAGIQLFPWRSWTPACAGVTSSTAFDHSNVNREQLPELLEASQLASANLDAVLVAYPADLVERNAMLAMNLESLRARDTLAPVHLDRRFNHEPQYRIVVHVSFQLFLILKRKNCSA
jgi:hypothetical protein